MRMNFNLTILLFSIDTWLTSVPVSSLDLKAVAIAAIDMAIYLYSALP